MNPNVATIETGMNGQNLKHSATWRTSHDTSSKVKS
jgi:hypothetical protein